ncbi:MAG: hypothetical protein V4488_04285 [Pseudomonadota bacterium]
MLQTDFAPILATSLIASPYLAIFRPGSRFYAGRRNARPVSGKDDGNRQQIKKSRKRDFF